MQSQLFVCDFNAAVSYWKFILAKFIPVVVPVPIVKIFPFGKIKQFSTNIDCKQFTSTSR